MINHDDIPVGPKGVGPNVSGDAENFFQSDADIKSLAKRRYKQKTYGDHGSPIQLNAKPLHFLLAPNSTAYVSLSSHVVEKIDLLTGDTLVRFRGHKGPITQAVLTETHLFTASWDKTIKKWCLEDGKCELTFVGHNDFVKSIVVDRNSLYSASTDRVIAEWDIATGKQKRTFMGHLRSVESIVLSPYGDIMYSASSDCEIKKWDLVTGFELESTGFAHLTSIRNLVLRYDDNQLFSVSADKTLCRWDLETCKCDLKLEHPDYVVSLVITPNGLIATGCRDENIRLWDPSTEKCVKVIQGHFGEVSHLVIQSGILWSSSLDCTLRRWDLSDPNLGQEIETVLPEFKLIEVALTEEEEAELAELMAE